MVELRFCLWCELYAVSEMMAKELQGKWYYPVVFTSRMLVFEHVWVVRA